MAVLPGVVDLRRLQRDPADAGRRARARPTPWLTRDAGRERMGDMAGTFTTILYETDGAVATITMNRPDMANAQDTTLINELDAAFDLADDDDAIRVVILAGKGKHFSSGHDLKALVGGEDPDEWVNMRETPEG